MIWFLAFVWLMGAVMAVVITTEDSARERGIAPLDDMKKHPAGYVLLALVWPFGVLAAIIKGLATPVEAAKAHSKRKVR